MKLILMSISATFLLTLKLAQANHLVQGESKGCVRLWSSSTEASCSAARNNAYSKLKKLCSNFLIVRENSQDSYGEIGSPVCPTSMIEVACTYEVEFDCISEDENQPSDECSRYPSNSLEYFKCIVGGQW